MGRYLARRVLYLFLVLLIITLLVFLIFYVMPPTDPAVAFAGEFTTPDVIAQIRESFGLDKPIHVQYWLFVTRLVTGDEYGWPGLGFSYVYRAPVKDLLLDRLPVSLEVAAGAGVLWLCSGIAIGIVSAVKRRTIVDRIMMTSALVGVSAPLFWVGLIALFFLWNRWHIHPGTGYEPISNFGGWISHMWLPWAVLAASSAAFYARMVRGNVLDTLGEDFIRTARAKGLSERRVIGKHALRASLTPVVTMFGMDIAVLVGQAVITETVFNLPGVGALTVDAANRGDLPLMLGLTMLFAVVVSLMSLMVDIVYAYLDPRIRYS